MMNGQLPRLSYSQLFSFQVAHNLVEAQKAGERYHVNLQAFKDMLKKGEWNRSILEVDFTNGMVFLQDKDKIVAAQPFVDFKKFVVSGDDFEDNLVSLRFTGQQWQIMTQNSAEKTCLLHLLQCVAKDTSAEEALGSTAPGTLGLNKSVLRAGILIRKAKTQFKKDERYCVLVPGKLFMFKNPNLPGQHVRYVTSLMGASVRMLQGLEFELLVPGTKTLTFVPDNVEEVTGWMGALERSVEIAQQLLAGGTYEQQDQVPNNVFATMNPGSMAGMIPGPSGGRGRFIQTSTHNLGAYTSPQDSRALQQRIMGGLGGGMFQQAQQDKPFFGAATHLSHSTPFGVTAPYAGNFQPNIAQGNLQNPMGVGNSQSSGGTLQQGGPSTSMPGQAGFMGQGSAGPSTSYNQPQGNFNTQNQLNSAMPGITQGPQGWVQGHQNRIASPGETGVRMIRRATQTLREFNNNMDQFLAQPSVSGYGGAAPQMQNPGFVRGAPQAQFQGYGGTQQAQIPAYGMEPPQTQVQGHRSRQQAQVLGYGRGGPQGQVQGAPQAQTQGYGGPQQAQSPGYGRGGPQGLVQGAPQAQTQGHGSLQQALVQGYARGGPQGLVQGAPQAQTQGRGSPQQAQVPVYRRGSPQGQVQGSPQAQTKSYAAAQQSQFQGYGRGAPEAQAQGYDRGAPQAQIQGYGGAQQGQAQGYEVNAPQAQMQNGAAQQLQVQQPPAYGGGAPQMQAPGNGRGAPQRQHPGARGGPEMKNPGYGRAGPMMPQQQIQGPAPGMAPAVNPGDWKEFTSPDGRIYYYNERTRQTTWTRPY